MTWLHRLIARHITGPPHISEDNTANEKSSRLASLSEEEQKAFRWLFEGFSEVWTTEALGLDKHNAKRLYTCIYRKLGVTSVMEIVLYYAPREIRFFGTPRTERIMKTWEGTVDRRGR